MESRTNVPDITFKVGPLYTSVEFAPGLHSGVASSTVKALREELSEKIPAHIHHPKVKARMWDGVIHLYQRGAFPTGLLERAIKVIESRPNLRLTHEIKQVGPVAPRIREDRIWEHMLYGLELRDYQVDAAQKLVGPRRGVAHMATNSGKTAVFAACIAAIGGRATIMVFSRDLLHQTAKAVGELTCFSVGLVGDGYRELDQMVTVGTVQSLSRMVDTPRFNDFAQEQNILVIDECHHTGKAQTVYTTAMAIPALWRFGFSGTPLTNDPLADLRLEAVTGPVRVRVTNAQMIEHNYSAVPRIRMIRIQPELEDEIRDALQSRDARISYQQAYREHIVENGKRNRRIVQEAITSRNQGAVVLVLVNQIKHLGELKVHFEKVGFYDLTYLTGKDPTSKRKEALDRMRDGGPGIYTATPLFDEGLDVPSINTLILGGGGKSHIKTLQRLGRGMRQKKDGENVLDVVDFWDDTNKFLRRHSKVRQETYLDEGFDVEVES